VFTLIVVPIIYSYLRKGMPTTHLLDEQLKLEEMAIEIIHG
jgi:hypothetical protein